MPLIPPIDELRKLYAAELANSSARALSTWNEHNFDDACDDEEYLKKALTEGPEFAKSICAVIEKI